MGDWIDIHTQNNLQYVFLPETSGAARLRVKAANDAHIALTNGPFESNPMTEIHIGGWDNTKSIVRRDRSEPDKVTTATPRILNANEFVDLWIKWQNNEVSAGVMGQPAFIEYLDLDPHPINHIAVRTGWGSIGHWKIQVSSVIFRAISSKPIERGHLRWVRKNQNEKIPHDALIGGYENGEVLYIARAMHQNSLIPGKYLPSEQCAYVGFGLHSHQIYNTCEILCGYNASWVKTRGDKIPPHAFAAGYATETNREPLFIGRIRIDNHLIPGKVHTHYRTCYTPYQGKEIQNHEYEILVLPDKLPDAVVWCTDNRSDCGSDDDYRRHRPRRRQRLRVRVY